MTLLTLREGIISRTVSQVFSFYGPVCSTRKIGMKNLEPQMVSKRTDCAIIGTPAIGVSAIHYPLHAHHISEGERWHRGFFDRVRLSRVNQRLGLACCWPPYPLFLNCC